MDITFKIIIAIVSSVVILYLIYWAVTFAQITGKAIQSVDVKRTMGNTDNSITRCDDPVYCKTGQPLEIGSENN